MNAKEKAVELVEKFRLHASHPIEENETNYYHQKQCALIAVDEMIKQNGELYLNGIDKDYYTKKNSELFELKSEIEKL